MRVRVLMGIAALAVAGPAAAQTHNPQQPWSTPKPIGSTPSTKSPSSPSTPGYKPYKPYTPKSVYEPPPAGSPYAAPKPKASPYGDSIFVPKPKKRAPY